jgi:type IV secretion system protein VirD4
LLVGSSGSGKSRSVIIPTIDMLALAGENMFISDVKGELYLYTAPKLKELGYNVIAIDYIQFLKSNCYNYLDVVINAVNDDNISLAESLINDLVNIIVEKNDKTEPIWKNGEMSVIKTAIMSVVLENKENREYQTLANAYYFIAEMFRTNKDGTMLIDKYMQEKEANNPIKKFFAISSVAPVRTRGSFVSAGLSTMQMFVDDYVATNTSKSDFDLRTFAKEKTAIYVLLPDDKDTYHKLASLLVQQLYTVLVQTSRDQGGELGIRMNFIFDEFANFTKIDSFQSMLTVSRGRNIRFLICVQSFSQIEERYGKEGAQNILNNCALMYLKSSDNDTALKVSDKLGTYTVQSYGESSNSNIKYDNSSSSMSLISRKLLTQDEVQRIESPYVLVMIAGKPPAICNIPDISQMHFNKLNGMGNQIENQALRIARENERKTRKVTPIKIWDVWKKYLEKQENVVQRSIQNNLRVREGEGNNEIKKGKNEESN